MQIIPVTFNDAAILLELSRKTFYDAFAHLNNAADIDAYAVKAFTLQKFRQELSNPYSYFYFGIVDDNIAGYIKINLNIAQTELQDPNALEVERIYILQQYQGQQLGKQLLSFAINTAVNKTLKYVWLGVWEHNYKAISFYESQGFVMFGSHPFVLGNDKQTDLLMKKEL
jgi:ribosomal protein S18 acetylase RimI-like enzyme